MIIITESLYCDPALDHRTNLFFVTLGYFVLFRIVCTLNHTIGLYIFAWLLSLT